MLSCEWKSRYQILGLSLGFTWVFCAFPAVDTTSIIQPMVSGPEAPWIVFAYTGSFAAIVTPFFASWFKTARSELVIMSIGCLLQLCGVCINTFLVDASSSSAVLFLGCFLAGTATSWNNLFWGRRLCFTRTETNEHIFMAVFILTGVLLSIIWNLLASYLLIIVFVIPLIQLICFFQSTRAFPIAFSDKRASALTAIQKRNLILLLVKSFVVFALVSFIWEIFATDTGDLLSMKESLFSIGFAAAALFLLLFTKYSPNTGFVLATRWAFPLMATGLIFSIFPGQVLLSFSYILLACAHAALEAILRIQIIGFSRQSQCRSIRIIGWGFASICVGAFFGTTSFQLMSSMIIEPHVMLIACVLSLLVVVASLLFGGNTSLCDVSEKDSFPHASDILDRSRRLAVVYALTNREQEILGFLLEGRSHPYIRDALYISKSTVDTHVRHIYRKMDIKSKQELIDLSKTVLESRLD